MNSAQQSDYTTNERRRKLLACLEATLQVITTNHHHPNVSFLLHCLHLLELFLN
jgi:hypothetical protein